MRLVSTPALALLFGVLFYLGYYAWWPAVFLVVTPLAILAEKRWGFGSFFWIAAVTAVTWLVVYSYFNNFSQSGLVILALYHGLIVALVVLSASWWRRRCGLPMCLVFPFVWVGGEFWRMSGSIGMPFGLLAQPAYEQLWMIQVSDLGGSYVLSFAMAMVGGLLADLIRERFSEGGIKWGKVRVALLSTAGVWIFVAGYGGYRLHESRETMTAGPVLAIVQNDFPNRSDGSLGAGSDTNVLMQELLAFSSESLNGAQRPALVVWPEAPSGIPPLNREWIERAGEEPAPEHRLGLRYRDWIQDWVDRHRTPVLLGSQTQHGNETRNTALRFDPGEGQVAKSQHKIHLFPAGEYLPWEGSVVHPWLERVVGQGRGNWITPGEQREIFTLGNEDGEPSKYAVAVCNEIIYPADVGTFHEAGGQDGKPIDFVINIANNGGFLRNHALVHNHILLPFRAVEGRLGIARSANTGISCFVKPTGEVFGEVTNSRGEMWTGKGAPEMTLIEEAIRIQRERGKALSSNSKLRRQFMDLVDEIKALRAEAGVSGQSVRAVYVDSRRTLYSRTGDLFGRVLLGILLVGILGVLSTRVGLAKKPAVS